MALPFCPDEKDENYKKLKGLLGEDGAFRMTYKMVEKEGIDRQVVYTEALSRIDVKNFPISNRKGLLVTPTFDERNEEYYIKGDLKLRRVSRQLDLDPKTKYNFASAGEEFADTGTVVHELASLIANGGSDANIEEFIKEKGLPKMLVPQLRNFVKGLEKKGTIVSEAFLVDITVENAPLGGSADIILLRHDGGIELYDFKTVSWTAQKRRTAKNNPNFRLWDPTHASDNYKARRYTTQLEYYARMIENTIGIPVKDKFIVPIELEFENDDTKGKMNTAVLIGEGANNSENVEKYMYVEEARSTVANFYGDRQKDVVYPEVADDKNSQTFINELIGNVEGATIDFEKAAAATERSRDGKKFRAGDRWIEFTGTTESEKIQQIIRDYIAPTTHSKKNLELSIVNYLKNGDTTFFDQIPHASEDLKVVLAPFLNKPGTQVYALNKVKGFEQKVNWIVVQNTQTDTFNLLYIGNEKLNEGLNNMSASKPLLGKFVDWVDGIVNFKSTLRNRYRDAKSLEAAMITMKLKQSNPKYNFDVVGIYSINDNAPGFQLVSLKDSFETLKAMNDHPKTKDLIPDDYKKILADPVLSNHSNYGQDFVRMMLHHIDTAEEEKKFKLRKSITDYIGSGDLKYKDMLLKEVKNEIANKKIIGEENLAASNEKAYELRLLSGMLFQLENIDLDLNPISAISNYARIPGNVDNELINRVNSLLHTAINKLANDFMGKYKTPFAKHQDAIFKEKSDLLSMLRDYTLGDTERNYDDLMVKQEVSVYDQDGTFKGKKFISRMEFVSEGSSEFASLTKNQQEFIRFINKQIKDVTEELGIKWKEGALPLVHGSVYSGLVNALRTGDKSAYKNILNKMMQDVEDNFASNDKVHETRLSNFFRSQEMNSDSDESRLDLLGIHKDGSLNLEAYNRWTQNVEVMMDVFMIQALKAKHFTDVAANIKAMNYLFRWSKTNLMQDRLGWNIKFSEWQYEAMINNRDIDAGTLKNKLVRTIQKGVSMAVLGFNPKSAFMQHLGMSLTFYSRAAANTFLRNEDFDLASSIKATSIIKGAVLTKAGMMPGKTFDKINKLMERYRMFDQDLSSFLNGLHRNGDKSLFTSKKAFAFMRAADWNAKAKYLVAQMIKDGTWDAFSLNEDGDLEYNELKDDRFRTMPADQARALKKYLLEAQNDDTEILKEPYSDDMMNSLRFKANMMYGGMDREVRVGANFLAEGKLFTSMKNWVFSRTDAYTMGKQNRNIFYGKISYEKDANGELYGVWTGEPVEGRLFSLLAAWKYMQNKMTKKDQKPLTEIQKKNITYFVGDSIMIMAAGLAASALTALGDDDDETQLDEYSAKLLRMAIGDLTVMYDLATLDPFFWTPVTLKYANKQIENGIAVATGESDIDRLTNNLPFAAQYKQFEYMVDSEN